MSITHRGLESKSELLFVLKLMRIRLSLANDKQVGCLHITRQIDMYFQLPGYVRVQKHTPRIANYNNEARERSEPFSPRLKSLFPRFLTKENKAFP